MHLINLLFITIAIVYMIDLSGFVDEIVHRLYDKYVGAGDYHRILPKLKPLSCGTCLTFWAGTIYLLVTGTFTFPMLAYVCVLSFLATTIGDLMMLIKDTLTKIINKLYELIDRQ